MVLRGIESMGFLLSVIAAPVLLRRWVTEPKALQRALGFWGAYMPIGMASALLVTPWAYDAIGWRWTWVLLAWASVAVAIIVLARVPPDADRGPLRETPMMAQALKSTLSAPGPWLVALAFMVYSGQWMAVIGFLPTIYHQAGWPPDWIGPLTAGAAGVNMIGNILAGRWLARGAWPGTLLAVGYLAMGVGAWGVMSGWLAPTGQYLSVLLFSWVGGMIPATLISLAMHLAPSRQTVTTTVGWVQQLSSMGQFLTPPLMAAIAADFGGWHHAVWLNLVLAGCGLWLAWRLQSRWSRLTR
jgi:predicted MFS family arabinose efflux permease